MKPIYLSNSMLVAYVDDEDYLDFCFYTFSLNNGYARRGDKRYLHQLLGEKLGFIDEVDHKDRDKLNNTRSNLRNATSTQNKQNMSKKLGTYSAFKGVTLDLRNGKWKAQIRHQDKNMFLGDFEFELDAARAYDKAALEFFGPFACINGI